jgi:hypothetical protein
LLTDVKYSHHINTANPTGAAASFVLPISNPVTWSPVAGTYTDSSGGGIDTWTETKYIVK